VKCIYRDTETEEQSFLDWDYLYELLVLHVYIPPSVLHSSSGIHEHLERLDTSSVERSELFPLARRVSHSCSHVLFTDVTMSTQWRHNAQSLMSICSITDIIMSVTGVTMLNYWRHNAQFVTRDVTMLNHWNHNSQSLMSIVTMLSHWHHNSQSLTSQFSVTDITTLKKDTTMVSQWC